MSVEVTESNNSITVSVSSPNTLTVGSPGPQGAQGPQGYGAFSTYTHSQASASSTWVINHNLNCKPSVTIVDSGGNVQIGEILYNSDSQVTVTFAASFSGFAYLN